MSNNINTLYPVRHNHQEQQHGDGQNEEIFNRSPPPHQQETHKRLPQQEHSITEGIEATTGHNDAVSEEATAAPPPATTTTSALSFVLKFSLGQLLAFTVSITGVWTTLLVEDNSSISTLQCITSYGLIVVATSFVYFTYIVCRREAVDGKYKRRGTVLLSHPSTSPPEQHTSSEENNERETTTAIMTTNTDSDKSYRGVGCQLWRFAGIAVVDVAANFTVVLAYAHTDMTSVQLLDCSSILWVMVLSYLLLKNVHYNLLWHIFGALVAVAGLVLLIVMDADGMSRTDNGKRTKGDVILGDILCLISALFYALSNVLSERVVRDSCGINRGDNDDDVNNNNDGSPEVSFITAAAAVAEEEEERRKDAAGGRGDGGGGVNGNSLVAVVVEGDAHVAATGSSIYDESSTPSSTTGMAINPPQQSMCKETTPLLAPNQGPVVVGAAQCSTTESAAGKVDGSSGGHPPSSSSWANPLSTHIAPPIRFVVIVEYLFWMALSGLIISVVLFFALEDYSQFASFHDHHIAPLHSQKHVHDHTKEGDNSHKNSSNSNETTTATTYAFQEVFDRTSYVDLSYNFAYGLSMVTVYTLMPVLFIVASATFANLSLLTADIYSVIWNVLVFGIYPKYSFLASFFIIVAGVVIFDTNGFIDFRRSCREKRRDAAAAAEMDNSE